MFSVSYEAFPTFLSKEKFNYLSFIQYNVCFVSCRPKPGRQWFALCWLLATTVCASLERNGVKLCQLITDLAAQLEV